jgi:glycosyltransferase involved in cell wall biosynthesis
MPSQGRKTGVLFISSAELPGADTFIHTLVMRSLDRSQFDVHVACSAGRPGAVTPAYTVLQGIPNLRLRPSNFGPSLTGLSPGRKVVELLGGAVRTVASLAGLALYVRRHGITVLHSTDRPRDAVACALLGKLTGAKSIVHAHLKVADWMSAAVRRSMANVDALIGVSEFVARSLVEYGYDADKTFAVLNAIDLPRWDPSLDGSAVRRELGLAADTPVIVSAARLFLGKGQDQVIRALPAIRREFPDVRVLIVGRDDLQANYGSFTAELKALARQLGVEDNVIFTGQRPDMPAVMAAATLFALPSDEEPFGLVFAEAMAMKKPVVALDNGGTPEVVDHGRSGLLSARHDVAGLAANILTLLRDPALAARMGEYGRTQVEARFTAARMAADVGKVYGDVAAASSARSTVLADEAAPSVKPIRS